MSFFFSISKSLVLCLLHNTPSFSSADFFLGYGCKDARAVILLDRRGIVEYRAFDPSGDPRSTMTAALTAFVLILAANEKGEISC